MKPETKCISSAKFADLYKYQFYHIKNWTMPYDVVLFKTDTTVINGESSVRRELDKIASHHYACTYKIEPVGAGLILLDFKDKFTIVFSDENDYNAARLLYL